LRAPTGTEAGRHDSVPAAVKLAGHRRRRCRSGV